MAMITTLNATQAYKIYYLPPFVKQFYNSTALLQRLKKTSKGVYGQFALLGAQTQQNIEGVHALQTQTPGVAGSAFPDPGNPLFDNPRIDLMMNAGTMQINEVAIELAADKDGAFVDMLSFNTQDLKDSFAWECNRQMCGDGSGVVAWSNEAFGAPQATCLVDDGGAAATAPFVGYGTVHHWAKPGMQVRRFSGGIPGSVGALHIAADSPRQLTVASTMAQLTVSANWNAMVDGDFFARPAAHTAAGGAAITAYHEMMGIQGIINNVDPLLIAGVAQPFQNIARAANTWNQAVRHDNPAGAGVLRAINFNIIVRGINAAENNGARITAGYMNYPVERAISNFEAGMKRYSDTVMHEGGFRVKKWEGIPFFVDKHIRRNALYLVDESTIMIYQAAPPKPWERDGNIFRPVPAASLGVDNYYPAIQMNMFWLANLGCTACMRNVYIADIQESELAPVAPHI